VLHVVGVILVVTIPWQAPRRASPDFIVLEPLAPRDTLRIAPFGGTRPDRPRGPTIATSARVPEPPAPPPPAEPPPAADTGAGLPAYDPDARLVPAPRVGDGRLWVSPRPGLPASVAEALYGDTTARDAAVVGRLRAMVDSVNQVIDLAQRERQRPTWTVGGGDGGTPKFGIDSQYIHVAGIKIPTTALAFLGSLLPQGNFDESMRARQLQEMRADLLRAADRAQTFRDFRRYVRELRERKQAERDAERRRRGQDTTAVIP
jgi:hypothetical protein